jgi:hypothetical protein
MAQSRAYRWGEDGLLGSATTGGSSTSPSRSGTANDPPEGAPLRPHRPRGEPRRGREGGVLLPRRDADALVRKALYKYPHAPFPYEELRRRRARAGRRAGARARDTGVFDGDATSTCRSSTRRPTSRTSSFDHDHQPRPARDARRAPDALVSQHVELGRRESSAGHRRRAGARASDARLHEVSRHRGVPRRRARSGSPRRSLVLRRGARADCSSPTTNTNAKKLWGTANARRS